MCINPDFISWDISFSYIIDIFIAKSNSIESFGIILLDYQNDLRSAIFKGKLFACKKVVQSSQQGIYHLNSIFYRRCTQDLAWSTSTLFLRFNGQFSSLQTLPQCISHVFSYQYLDMFFVILIEQRDMTLLFHLLNDEQSTEYEIMKNFMILFLSEILWH